MRSRANKARDFFIHYISVVETCQLLRLVSRTCRYVHSAGVNTNRATLLNLPYRAKETLTLTP